MSRTTRKTQLNVENLEERTLLTTAVLRNGLLAVQGTNAAETINFRQINNRIQIDGVKGSFVASQVKQIVVDGKGGNDRIFLNQVRSAPATIYGGTGNDTILGTAALDRIFGGDGNDSLNGFGGNDVLQGGLGNDVLRGGVGNDQVSGGAGADQIWGDAGIDWLRGDGGLDHLFAAPGDDYDGGYDGYYDQYTVYFDPTSPAVNGATWADIQQGQDGNCTILATLSTAAYHEDLTRRIEYYGYENGSYWYKVYLHGMSNGEIYQTFQWVAYDGTSTDAEPLPTDQGEFWVILFDRAVKQQAIEDGSDFRMPSYTMSVITGRWTDERVNPGFNGGTWNMDDVNYISRCLANGYDVLAYTIDSWAVDADTSTPLTKNHSYTVFGIDSSGNVWLRNPWHIDANYGSGKTITGDFYDGQITISWAEFTSYMHSYCIA